MSYIKNILRISFLVSFFINFSSSFIITGRQIEKKVFSKNQLILSDKMCGKNPIIEPTLEKDKKIKFLHVLLRHGARNPGSQNIWSNSLKN